MTEIESLYRLYFKDVYLFLKGLSKDEQIAQDMTSETFLKAIKSLDSFQGTCDVRVWLCQIAKNSYYSYLRKHRKLVDLDTVLDLSSTMDLEESVASAEASMKVHS